MKPQKPKSVFIQVVNLIALVGISLLAVIFLFVGFYKVQFASQYGYKELIWALGLFIAGLTGLVNIIGWLSSSLNDYSGKRG